MSRSSAFAIQNECDAPFTVYVEPEGVPVLLQSQERIIVNDRYERSPITIQVDTNADGARVLSLWPGDGDMVVTKNGRDVLDLA